MPLRLPRGAEPDVNQTNRAPDQERRDAAQVDNVPVRLAGASADVHHRDGAARVGEDDGVHGHASLISPPEELGRFAVLRHVQDGTAADVDGAVDSAEAGDENKGVDEVDAVGPAGVLERHRHGRLEGAAGAADQFRSVGRARQPEKEGAAHVDKDDANEDLADGVRDGDARVLGLGRGDGNGLDTRVEGGAEDEDGGNAAETIGKWAGIVPVLEADGVGAFDAAGDVPGFGVSEKLEI